MIGCRSVCGWPSVCLPNYPSAICEFQDTEAPTRLPAHLPTQLSISLLRNESLWRWLVHPGPCTIQTTLQDQQPPCNIAGAVWPKVWMNFWQLPKLAGRKRPTLVMRLEMIPQDIRNISNSGPSLSSDRQDAAEQAPAAKGGHNIQGCLPAYVH